MARLRREKAELVKLTAAERGEVPPLTDAQAEAEARGLCASMDGLEIQWLLDPTVDLAGLFGFHLDHTLERWKSGAYAPLPLGGR
ncbi:hypothetical protein [Nonomuraea sp. NPDC049158]|uniref:hypothetical protein n=1 Tax=Nonomuraea sp. NPDC049158 TaxID=3155649 RepID=UPI0033F442BE